MNYRYDKSELTDFKIEEIKWKIKKFAVTTRIFVITLQIFSNYLVPDHDAKVFLHPKYKSQKPADEVIDLFFGGLNRWDSQHFLHIAEFGYSHENTLAFFPLYPCVVRILSRAIYAFFELQFIITFHSVLLVVAVISNIVFFSLAAVCLYELSREVLKEERLAYVSALLFCINPASIFFTAPYSEAMFCYFSFKGLLLWQSKIDTSVFISILSSSILFGLAFVCRSNGFVLIFYIIFRIGKQFLEILKYHKSGLRARSSLARKSICLYLFGLIFILSISIIFIFTPVILFQVYTFIHFCLRGKPPVESYLLSSFVAYNQFVLPGTNATWCSHNPPLSYSYVQTKYWNLGFLNYYKIKQIPNFLLAFPVVLIIFKQTFVFLKKNFHYFFQLGAHEDRIELYYSEVTTQSGARKINRDNLGIFRKTVLPYVLHAFALTVVGLFYFHVQILTRMISSSCPVFYWFASHLSIDHDLSPVPVKSVFSPMEPESVPRRHFDRKTRYKIMYEALVCDLKHGPLYDLDVNCEGNYVLRFYFLSYLIVGCIMFSNFLPWT